MHGGRGEDSGVLNVIESPVPPPNGLYSPVVDGSSFVMATEFTGHGPRTRTILTYSESANPASPFANDQTRLFSAKEWLQERFTRSEVLADPALTTLSLSAPRPPVVLGAPR
jgi:acyl-homoserine-lactone acylase